MQKTIADMSTRWLRRKPDALSESESRVLQRAMDRLTISEDKSRHHDHGSVGDSVADGIARVGGSWTFIISFIVFLVIWTLANVWLLGRATFDPYPFVFLNLVLSMIAALQAPVIMMSQNRQTERDRLDASHDYEVNLKAEIEILALHEKLDALRQTELVALREEVAAIAQAVAAISAAQKLSRPGKGA
ncbi:MAG TPA: DUF1003 domain-containing protein [Mesorhizobium sp.]|jgi:uncharacterized membrane protein